MGSFSKAKGLGAGGPRVALLTGEVVGERAMRCSTGQGGSGPKSDAK